MLMRLLMLKQIFYPLHSVELFVYMRENERERTEWNKKAKRKGNEEIGT